MIGWILTDVMTKTALSQEKSVRPLRYGTPVQTPHPGRTHL